ncbi:MAG: peptidylprolyl isomerase [Cyclobacteriaceae bacterium]|nr:peptidylprolyl isomerase [Cyclobacteriaceae bacterium]
MALINTLRNKMGKFVVVLVAAAILSFILNDLLGNNSVFMQDNNVGEINGENISIPEYQQTVETQERNFSLYANRPVAESDKASIHDRAWKWLITQYAFSSQYEEVGVEVSADELWDMLQGTHIDPTIRSFFSDQTTGEFDRQSFMQFYQNRNAANPQMQYIWQTIYENIKPARLRLKYENPLLMTSFVTDAEAMQQYHVETDVAEIKYLYVPFYSVSDSIVKVSNQQLQEYYNKNKERYKTEHLKNIEYVSFPIITSSADTAEIRTEVDEIISELKTTTEDSLYATSNSDGMNPFGRYHKGTLPFELSIEIDSLKKGQIKGPYLSGGNYVVYKITDVYTDTTYYAKARHILFKTNEGNEEANAKALEDAQRVLGEIKNGANFALMAQQYGSDGTASRGGDLGWFSTGRMVKEFEEAVFKATEKGLLSNLVKTDFGYHIVDITELKTNKMYAVTTVERSITPSDRTIDDVYRKADLFKSVSTGYTAFKNNAEKELLEINVADDLKSIDRFVGDLGDARGIVQWLFRDASEGDVSDIFEVNDSYIVAVMTGEVEKGYKPLEKVKAEIEIKVKNKLKAEKIAADLKAHNGSLDEIASAYGEDAAVNTSNDLKFSSNSLPGVGFDPYAVGKAFSLGNGEKTEPFAGENGVLIIEMINKTVAPEVADYTSYKSTLENSRRNSTSEKISEAIEEYADIKDKRYKVY